MENRGEFDIHEMRRKHGVGNPSPGARPGAATVTFRSDDTTVT